MSELCFTNKLALSYFSSGPLRPIRPCGHVPCALAQFRLTSDHVIKENTMKTLHINDSGCTLAVYSGTNAEHE